MSSLALALALLTILRKLEWVDCGAEFDGFGSYVFFDGLFCAAESLRL
jgi:hypothetical protein